VVHRINVAKFDLGTYLNDTNWWKFRQDVEEMFSLAPQTWYTKLLLTGDSKQLPSWIGDLLEVVEPKWVLGVQAAKTENIDQQTLDHVRELARNIILTAPLESLPRLSPMTTFVVRGVIGGALSYSSRQVAGSIAPVFRTDALRASFLDIGEDSSLARFTYQHHCRYVAKALAGSLDDEVLRPSPYSLQARLPRDEPGPFFFLRHIFRALMNVVRWP
jgi:hypothetical protein